MSEIDSIKSKPKASRILHKVHFDFAEAEVSYTDPSQGGAASGLNDALLFKSSTVQPKKEDLTQGQLDILASAEEEFTPLLKQKSNTQSPSSVESDTGEETIMSKGNEKLMTIETNERVAQLEKALAVSNAVNAMGKFGLDADLEKELVDAVASLDGLAVEAVVKALDAVEARAIVAQEAAVEKAVAAVGSETDLQKALGKEAGESGEPEEVVEKTLADKINDKLNKA